MHFHLHRGTEIDIYLDIGIDIDKYRNIHISVSCFTPSVIALLTFLSKTLTPYLWLCHHSITRYMYSVLFNPTFIHFYMDSRETNMNYMLISSLLICRFIGSVLATNSRM